MIIKLEKIDFFPGGRDMNLDLKLNKFFMKLFFVSNKTFKKGQYTNKLRYGTMRSRKRINSSAIPKFLAESIFLKWQ